MSNRSPWSRWFGSTSNRTFIVWPLALAAAETLLQGGWPNLNVWALPLLAWGYLQYRLTGNLRLRKGRGGPGIAVPPERLVFDGPYRVTRNPMYLGHLIFLLGLALLLGSWLAGAVLAWHTWWFDRRVRDDEARLAELFGAEYRRYQARVKRWLPGIY